MMRNSLSDRKAGITVDDMYITEEERGREGWREIGRRKAEVRVMEQEVFMSITTMYFSASI